MILEVAFTTVVSVRPAFDLIVIAGNLDNHCISHHQPSLKNGEECSGSGLLSR